MKEIDIDRLVEWLGAKGAIAGLQGSKVTAAELSEIAASRGLDIERKTKRRDVIVDLVNGDSIRIDKTMDELLAMSSDHLKGYFNSREVSRTELLRLLSKFDICPTARDRVNLVDFAAREISDVGMYQRVAKGTRGRVTT